MSIKRHGVGPRLSQAAVHGDTVYLAWMVAGDHSADTKGQTEQILKKIDETLAAVGSHKSKLLSATVYLANMATYNDMNAAWDAWVDKANTPARATVEARLASPKYLVAIMCFAAIYSRPKDTEMRESVIVATYRTLLAKLSPDSFT